MGKQSIKDGMSLSKALKEGLVEFKNDKLVEKKKKSKLGLDNIL